MTQKLLIMERDTREELQQAIEKSLEDNEFRMISLSVLKGLAGYEAWILLEDHSIAGFE